MLDVSHTVRVSFRHSTAYELLGQWVGTREQSCSGGDATIPGCEVSFFPKPYVFQALYMALKSAAFLCIYFYF